MENRLTFHHEMIEKLNISQFYKMKNKKEDFYEIKFKYKNDAKKVIKNYQNFVYQHINIIQLTSFSIDYLTNNSKINDCPVPFNYNKINKRTKDDLIEEISRYYILIFENEETRNIFIKYDINDYCFFDPKLFHLMVKYLCDEILKVEYENEINDNENNNYNNNNNNNNKTK